MKNKTVWLATFIICLLGAVVGFFGSIFIRFLYAQNQIIGITAFILCCIVLTNLIYCVVTHKELKEKSDKNEP